ncbi:TetR/AcrR family transcriptional regulator [Amycolatopsis jejuensis]|uniref:TetR/AcrR family transcriptional regulator n=1 Tax=Amycolatopsis jejuensis TaxID=330084 RepID=UPI00052434E5|nr:TetR/AcrR family transcriptional regulator [Amycolatopsis jejuensis]
MSTAERGKGSRSGLRRTLMTSELLDTATRLFAEKGYEATSLLDIANALNISRPALYHYVSKKDDLLAMLVEQVTNGFAEVLAQLKARDDLTPPEKIADVVGLMVRQRAVHSDQFRILDRSEPILPEPLATEHLAAKRKILRELTALVEAGIETGEFRPVDARTTALSLLGMCNWVAWWFRSGSDVEPVVATITGLAAAMLAAGDHTGRGRQDAKTIGEIRALLDRLEG